MCNIAAYNGTKSAAPILIEMLKKQEYFDGGLSTGIATIDNDGNLYYAKVIGSTEDLSAKTDALNFPGTVGIIHSRPDDNFIEHAHPFVCENGKTAIVENGNMCKDEALVKERDKLIDMLLKKGVEFESAKEMERSSYPQLPDGRYVSYIEVFAKYIDHLKETGYTDYCEIMSEAASKIFSDVVWLMVSANSPGNIYVSRISRPMNIMATEGETYLSTSQLAFPEADNVKYTKTLPRMKTCVISKDGFEVSDYPILGGNVIDFNEEEYKTIEDSIRQKLLNAPTPMSDMGGGIMVANTAPDKFRPNVKAVYDSLWQFKKEGILKSYVDDNALPWLPGKTVKSTFFYI